jgi:hypothetical protein
VWLLITKLGARKKEKEKKTLLNLQQGECFPKASLLLWQLGARFLATECDERQAAAALGVIAFV